jgi:hypothetical protein
MENFSDKIANFKLVLDTRAKNEADNMNKSILETVQSQVVVLEEEMKKSEEGRQYKTNEEAVTALKGYLADVDDENKPALEAALAKTEAPLGGRKRRRRRSRRSRKSKRKSRRGKRKTRKSRKTKRGRKSRRKRRTKRRR